MAPPGGLREASREHFLRKFQFLFRFRVRAKKMKHVKNEKVLSGGFPEAPRRRHLRTLLDADTIRK